MGSEVFKIIMVSLDGEMFHLNNRGDLLDVWGCFKKSALGEISTGMLQIRKRHLSKILQNSKSYIHFRFGTY